MSFLPLTGIRVVDFTWNVAGPGATQVLAALGADVIKVEFPTRPDPGRYIAFSPVTDGNLDSSGFFADTNIGKRGVSIDPRNPDGLRLIEELVEVADVVAESYSARVLPSWGLTFDRMSELNDHIVYLSVSGFGHSGPHADYVSYGPTAQAASGVTWASGEPGKEPAGWGYSFLDVITGYHAAYAVTAALVRQDRGPNRIDLSQVETGATMLAPLLMDAMANGSQTSDESFPPGNRSAWPTDGADGYRYERGAPYGVYPTADDGTDGFCAISVLQDDQWQALVRVMGCPEWATNPHYDDAENRITAQDEIDLHLGEWTRTVKKYELMEALQGAGVPAGALQSGRDRLENDPSLRARQVFQEKVHPVVGQHRYEGLPVQVDGAPLLLPDHWPLLGHDTDTVLSDWLGYDSERCADLRTRGVTWPVDVPHPVHGPGVDAL